MVDWAAQRGVGFSGIVSIGDQLDVDIADLLDYFALDGKTRAILLYVEAIKDARKFMSAARAAARIKPVVVVKSGRMAQGAKAAATHTGALAGSDAVYDAAFHRAGILRVSDLRELFDCAETLGRVEQPSGKRLAILTNGGGIGVLAVDRLVELGGIPAAISPATREKLDAFCPGPGPDQIRSISSATPIRRAIQRRSRRCWPTQMRSW
jgi:acetyltransferase